MALSSSFKKFAWGFLVVAAALPFSTALAFSDVPQGNLHFAAIEDLKAKGIINGYADGTFQPDKTINRAEAVKVVVLAQKILNPQETTDNLPDIAYPDVAKTDWFYDYVKTAAGKKIVEGYPDKTFRPATTINAVESLKIILLGFGADTNSTKMEGNPFPDVSSTDWFGPYVNFAQKKQLIEPQNDGNYAPSHDMTRAEFAEIIYRLLYIQQNKLDVFPISLNWPIFNDPQGNYNVHFPIGWQAMMAGTNVILWKQDIANHQNSFARIAPNSAVLIGAVDDNADKKSLEDYVNGLKLGATADKQILTLNTLPFASVNFADQNLQNYYFELPNGKIVSFFAQVGDGGLSTELKQEVRYILGSVRTGIDPTAATNSGTSSTASGINATTNTSVTTGADTSSNLGNSSTTGTTDTGSTTATSLPTVAADVRDQTLSQVREKILVQGQGKAALVVFHDLIISETDSLGVGTGPIDYYYSAQFNVSVKYERNSDTILAVKDGKTSAF